MLIDQLQSDLKQAQLNREELKVGTLRMLLSEVKNSEIAKGQQLSDADFISVVQKEVKKRKEAAEGFTQGGRAELAQKEQDEAKILSVYLPAQLSDEQLTKMVEEAIAEVGASGIADMGKVIGKVMGKVAGQAEGGRVSAIVKLKLS